MFQIWSFPVAKTPAYLPGHYGFACRQAGGRQAVTKLTFSLLKHEKIRKSM